jgi:hypothetical protein
MAEYHTDFLEKATNRVLQKDLSRLTNPEIGALIDSEYMEKVIACGHQYIIQSMLNEALARN